MIGKVMQNSSFKATTSYVLSKEAAELMGGNMGGKNTLQLTSEFLMSRNLNPDIKRPVYHFTLSLPHHEHLNNSQWLDLARNYVQEMGLDPERNQYFVARHSDQTHDHIHIVASRINVHNGKAIETWRDRYRSQAIIRKLERDYRLKTIPCSWEVGKQAMTKSQLEKLEQTGVMPVKHQLQQLIDQAAARQPTLTELVRQLQTKGVEVQLSSSRTGDVRGISYALEVDSGRVAIAGSDIGSHYSLPGLQNRLGISFDPHRDLAIFQKPSNLLISNSGIPTAIALQEKTVTDVAPRKVQQKLPRTHTSSPYGKDRNQKYKNSSPSASATVSKLKQSSPPKQVSKHRQHSASSKEVRALAALISAKRILDAISRNSYETDHYAFKRWGEVVTISAKDGRARIAQGDDTAVSGNLSAKDSILIRQLEKSVLEEAQQQEAQAQLERGRSPTKPFGMDH